MKTLVVYDPPLCCSTGVCGADVDSELVAMAAWLRDAERAGVDVRRFNLAQEPLEFVRNPAVRSELEARGPGALPILFVDGERRWSGEYPSPQERAALLGGLSAEAGPSSVRVTEPSDAVACARGEEACCCDCGFLGGRDLLARAEPVVFVTGKGGVGKTSVACSIAIGRAGAGRRVLLVSTDPASNLDEVLGVRLGREPRAVPAVSGLWALNIDPGAEAAAYREQMLAPLRSSLPQSAISLVEEQLSGACTQEIAAFDAFTRILAGEEGGGFDAVIFDTAPTGHTLRLLALPAAWKSFLDTNTSGTSCLGPLSGLQSRRAVFEGALARLRDPSQTLVVLVSRAQRAALVEAERAGTELAQGGMCNQVVVLNGLLDVGCGGDELATAIEHAGDEAIDAYADFLGSRPTHSLPLRGSNLVGVDALRGLLAGGADEACSAVAFERPSDLMPCTELVESLESDTRVVLVMGKGGVGKTTLAAALAHALARKGHQVHLTTTDPAAQVELAAGAAESDRLTYGRIDPAAETEAYVREVLAAQGAGLGAEARALLEEDLRSPCTEEIAVFRAFARSVASAKDRIVVMDTAPTGHTLLLLDASEAHHRELGRQSRGMAPEALTRLIERLRDPSFCRVVLVAHPEPTPLHEGLQLEAELRRAGIRVHAWVLNQCLSLTATRDPVLSRRAASEKVLAAELSGQGRLLFALPLLAQEPRGCAALGRLFQDQISP